MPMVRYQIRNEYGLSGPELYGAAEKDDPEALMEGVAMAGLVGLLRQLGDLAEFAAEIFHDLHEEVMATACRGHGLTLRLRQIEADFPSVENSLVSQISLPYVLQNDGIEFHANIQTDRNLITSGDMPRFVMDSYEECRGPPRLFTLDKFDVAGAGACLKRYSDPSFFKTEMSKSSDSIESEDSPREKKPRKIKKKAFRLRKGETLESLLISCSESQPTTENQAPIVRRVKLKSRKSQNSENNNIEKIHHSILVGLIESQQNILLANSEKDSCFKKKQNGIIVKAESLGNDPSDYVELERETNGEAQNMHKIFPIQEQNDFSSEFDKIETQKENANEKGSLNQTKDNKVLGDSDELENFVDALNTIESETESEKKIHKLDPIINLNNNDNNKEGLESSSQKGLENEFDEVNEEFFDNDDLMDVSSTSSWRSDGARQLDRQLDGPSVSHQNDLILAHKSELSDSGDSKALFVNEAELNDEKSQRNLEDLPSSLCENHAEKMDSPFKNQVEEPISNDSFEEFEIPILNSEEIKISDEAWIEKESLVSNEEETKLTNESINGEDSSVSKLEGTIEGRLTREDSLVSNEENNLRNESINETFNVQDSSVSNKEEDFILDDIISEGLEDPNFSANKLEETNENHNEVSQVELRNISDEILNLEEYLISNRDYDNIERNKSSNEKDESLLDTQSEKAQDDFIDSLQYDQKYKSDEILNHEDLISFREEENIPTYEEQTINLPKHMDGLESEENADYLSGEKDENTLEEALIQPNENTLLFQEPKDYSNEPFSPNSQTDDCTEPLGSLRGLDETLNPKQEEENSLKTLETLNPKKEEENSLKTLDSFEEIQQQHEEDWQEYLFEEESKVDSVKHIQENEPTHYNFENNNFNFLDESLERYSENPFETNTHSDGNDKNAQNLILWSDNEEEYETLAGEFNAGAKQEFPNSDFLWEPASPPRESAIEPFVVTSQNGAPGSPTVFTDKVHHEPDRFSDATNKSECESGLQDPSVDHVHGLLPNESETKAYENEVLVETFNEKEEECVDSGLPSLTVDQVHHELWDISDPPVDQVHELSAVSDPSVDQVHDLSGLSDTPLDQDHELSGLSGSPTDQVHHEQSSLSDTPMDQVHEQFGLSDSLVNQVHEPSGPSDPLVDQFHDRSLLEDLDSKSNESLSEKDYIEPNNEQSEFSNETENISQSGELSTAKIVPSVNLGFDNNNQSEEEDEKEDSDVKPHDFSHDSCTNEKPLIDYLINETDEKPLINALSTAFTGLDSNPNPNIASTATKPNPNFPSIDTKPNPNSSDLDLSDIFSSISQNSNSSSQNEDKPPPLPPLGWRLGGKLRKGISLPLNGFLPVITPDPFAELPCIVEPKQAGIIGDNSNLFKPINTPDPFAELPCVVEPKQADIIGDNSNLFKPINAPGPFVEMPCIVEPKQDDIGNDSNLFKPVNAPDLFVEMPCIVDIGSNSDLSKPVNMPDPFEIRSESISNSDARKESELSNDLTDDSQRLEREKENEKEKPRVVSLFNLPPFSNPNPQVGPFLGQNVHDFEHKAGPSPDSSTNVSPVSNPSSQPNPILCQNIQNVEPQVGFNPDPITSLPPISNPNSQPNPILGQNPQNLNPKSPNPDPNQNPPPIPNPNPAPNPISAQNPHPQPPNPNPNPAPNPYLGHQNPDPSPNLFLPVPGWAAGPVHQPGYLIPVEDNLWAHYGIGPSLEDERLARNIPYSIRNIPRNPLMDAVAAHDRSTMRKVSGLVRPTDESKSDERNSLLEQIRNKSFSLRPVSAPKTTAVKAPQTNLKVAAIVEKANAIRQACVGSDEEDEDGWSDA